MDFKVGDEVYVRVEKSPDVWRRVILTQIFDKNWDPEIITSWATYDNIDDEGYGSNYLSETRPISPLILLAECAE